MSFVAYLSKIARKHFSAGFCDSTVGIFDVSLIADLASAELENGFCP